MMAETCQQPWTAMLGKHFSDEGPRSGNGPVVYHTRPFSPFPASLLSTSSTKLFVRKEWEVTEVPSYCLISFKKAAETLFSQSPSRSHSLMSHLSNLDPLAEF